MARAENVPVVACTLGARDLAAQAGRWRELRSRAEISRAETQDGLSLAFRDAPDVETELRELVAFENDCCSWARWRVFHQDGTLVMQASSTAHGVDALHAMLR
jgi:hypothetical protein